MTDIARDIRKLVKEDGAVQDGASIGIRTARSARS
jgi:hypothetical protein